MDEVELKDYELSFLLGQEKDVEDVLKLLKHEDAEIIFEGTLKKIPLAYKIKKQSEAYFGYLHFRISKERVKSLEKNLLTTSTILRFLIVTPPFVRPKPEPRARQGAVVTPPAQVSVPLSNEALERKIEEILK
ncbi:MAG: 30S ribosomal protein S6 [Candidatus Liptonbacteria bacterium]|nr:30S ribosomal protein S6 [Candidatus Liptonbacteria bacterium]